MTAIDNNPYSIFNIVAHSLWHGTYTSYQKFDDFWRSAHIISTNGFKSMYISIRGHQFHITKQSDLEKIKKNISFI